MRWSNDGARQVISTLWPSDADTALDFVATYSAWREGEYTTTITVFRLQNEVLTRHQGVISRGAQSLFGDW